MTDTFSARVVARPDMPAIELSGQIDRDAETELLAAFEHAAAGADRIALDFSTTEYINSTGLAVLVQLLAQARTRGCELHAFGLSDHYREIFEITRLSDFVTLHAEPTAA